MSTNLREATRSLRRHPAFTVPAILTLAVGIAATTIVFTLVDALMLRPMPVPDADRVVRAYPVDSRGRQGNLFSFPDYRDYREHAAVFGAIAAVLAAVGIYGVIAGSVELRTRELGVRVALGATGGSILRMVLVEGLWLVGIGLVVGLAASLALSGTLATLLYEIRPTDAATLASIAALTVIVSLVASLVPAVRALRVDPVTALRAE